MSVKHDNEIRDIEAAQRALRESIEATKGLAERAENLLQKHKDKLDRDAHKAAH